MTHCGNHRQFNETCASCALEWVAEERDRFRAENSLLWKLHDAILYTSWLEEDGLVTISADDWSEITDCMDAIPLKTPPIVANPTPTPDPKGSGAP